MNSNLKKYHENSYLYIVAVINPSKFPKEFTIIIDNTTTMMCVFGSEEKALNYANEKFQYMDGIEYYVIPITAKDFLQKNMAEEVNILGNLMILKDVILKRNKNNKVII